MDWSDLVRITSTSWWIWAGFAIFFSPVWISIGVIFLVRRLLKRRRKP